MLSLERAENLLDHNPLGVNTRFKCLCGNQNHINYQEPKNMAEGDYIIPPAPMGGEILTVALAKTTTSIT